MKRAFTHALTISACKCAQGFGKRKNMVGMARSKKKKVEADEQLAEDDRSVATDAVALAAGEGEASSPGASQSSSDESVCFTA